MFQIRSSWAQFCSIARFERVEFSITSVFSTTLNIPTPPPPPFFLKSKEMSATGNANGGDLKHVSHSTHLTLFGGYFAVCRWDVLLRSHFLAGLG